MSRRRFTAEQIIADPREAAVEVSRGPAVRREAGRNTIRVVGGVYAGR